MLQGILVGWSRMAKCLQSLVSETLELMTELKMLKRFQFSLNGNYDHFYKRLNNKWEVSKYGLLDLKRKI